MPQAALPVLHCSSAKPSGSLARLDCGGGVARSFRGGSMQAVQRGPAECGLGAGLKPGSSSTLGDDFGSGSSGGTLGLAHGPGRRGSLRRRQRGMGSPGPLDGRRGPLGIGALGRGAFPARRRLPRSAVAASIFPL